MTNTVIQHTRFIRCNEVTKRTGLCKSTVYDLMKRDLFPKNIKLSGGYAVAWLESEIDEWMTQQLANRQAQG